MNATHNIHSDCVVDWFAVKAMASGAKGIAPDAGLDDSDPDWQPL